MISPKLIELQHLQYLHLTSIDFNESQIPDFIGSLTNLRNLSLHSCNLVGQIPSSFGNLTQLQNLDLSGNQLQPKNLNWPPALSSLTDLDLSANNVNQIPDFIGSLTNLRNLRLSSCNLVGPIPSSFGNLTQLQHLDLRYNQLQLENLNWPPALSSLTDLDLSGQNLNTVLDLASIDFIGSLTNLRYLSLSSCNLVGEIPSSFGNLTQLQLLDLADNQLQAENLNWLPALSSLTDLDLSGANLSTVFDWPEAVLNKLPKLVALTLVNCSLPPPLPTLYKTNSSTSLAYVSLSDNHLTSSIFLWLSNYSLATLELSNNKLSGFIPDFIGNMSSLLDLDLSDNQIEGANPNSFARVCNLQSLLLQRNHLSGQLSQLLPRCAQNSLEELVLSENVLAGSLNNLTSFSSLKFLNLSANQLSGNIPESIGQMLQLWRIDFSMNSLEGMVSETHFSKLSKLNFLDLSSNSLVLNFHSDWVPPFKLGYINLASCKVGPLFPKWLQTQNDSFLQVLDISNAGISDILPSWFWSNFRDAGVINLSQNLIRGIFTNLTAEFPILRRTTFKFEPNRRTNTYMVRCELQEFGYPDAFHQSLQWKHALTIMPSNAHSNYGFLYEQHLWKHTQMPQQFDYSGSKRKSKSIQHTFLLQSYGNNTVASANYEDDASFIWKGRMQKFKSIWGLVKRIDLSSNRLTGEIPCEITHLVELVSLNLSRNRLTGQITPGIGNLQSLDSLDLSRNQIDGRIPRSLARIDRLSFLDLSYNNLSGKIPTGTSSKALIPLFMLEILNYVDLRLKRCVPIKMRKLT
ncbi:receptor-like protein 12 isoform X1 [Prunus yedoensis var. nudiflora]|uniref:Receptor-like protein 12 isoform X1 n=1 Tax=Prunus yedoensis var. nudiflora TaxID=2094558 RepID=A0A314ZF70_PRUYE|nr:receptor-like protein 12 isoform X1 [Prunus yedoensis var. nudiflora]